MWGEILLSSCGGIIAADGVACEINFAPTGKIPSPAELAISGPVFRSAKFTAGGLVGKDGQPLTWFTLAGPDGKFVPADAKIVGETGEVSVAEIEKLVTVRFVWDETVPPNFFNQAGLPAEPFRTDAPGKLLN